MALRPERFVPRSQLDELVARLCVAAASPDGGGSVAISTALRGAGGFGKTTLAQELCHDERVRQAYPDGIAWVTLGEQPSDEQILRHVFDLIRWAGGEPTAYSDVNMAGAELREVMAGRRILLVVDDVWRSGDLAPFRGAGAALLVTTRDKQILPRECQVTEVDAMAQRESSALLGWQLEVHDYAASELAGLAERLGRWPLLLDLVNAQLRDLVADGMSPGEAVRHVTGVLDEEGLTAFDLDDDVARQTAVARTVAASLGRLGAEDRQRYEMLAVFPEDADIPLAALARYWAVRDSEARKLCERLHRRSLLQRFDRAARTIGLHDVFRRYLVEEQGEGMPALHRRWLDTFRPQSGRWSELPLDERHGWRYLAYHLRGAGEAKTLRGLLLDYYWLDARLRAAELDAHASGGPAREAGGINDAAHGETRERRGGPEALIGDFAYAEDHEDVRLVRDALRLSSHMLARDPDQLAGQLVGRLMLFEDRESIGRLLAQARAESRRAWLCPQTPSLTPPGGPLVRTLAGHTSSVNDVAVTLDGTRAISASEDHTLKVWDLASGRVLHTLSGHSRRVSAVAVTPDGARAVSVSRDPMLKIWDLASGQVLHTLHGHSGIVSAVAVTTERAVSAAWDRTLKVWDLASGRLLHTLHGHSSFVSAVAVTPDGAFAISASDDCTLKVWDLTSGRLLHTLHGHSGIVTAVAVTPDGVFAISACHDCTLKVWDLASGHVLHTLHGHSSPVRAVVVTPDGANAVTASEDHALKVWDLASGRLLHTLHGHSRSVTAVAVTPDGANAISVSQDFTLKVWDLASGRLLYTLYGHSGFVSAVAVTPDGAFAISASWDHTLKVWNLASSHARHTLHGQSGSVSSVAVTPDGARAISASWDRTLKVWDLASSRVLHTLSGHSRRVSAVAVTPDGTRAISASKDCTLKIWDLASGRVLHTLHGHSHWVSAVTVTPDGARAISASKDCTLKIWDVTACSLLRTLHGHLDWVFAVAVTPDGARAISASRDSTLKIWDLASGRELHTLHGHLDAVSAVAVTPDGARAISVSWDHTLKIWDLASGRELHTLHGHLGPIFAVASVPDSARAISVSADRLKVWDLALGCEITTFIGDGDMLACAYEPNRGMIVAGDAVGQVHLLRLIEPSTPADSAQPAAIDSAAPQGEIMSTPSPSISAAPTTSSLRILHISDLHTRGERESKQAYRRKQVLGDAWLRHLDELADDGRAFDLVVFTGDVADWGLPDEYAATTPWLMATLERLRVPPARLFIVPGNHDIHRRTEQDAWTKLREGISHAAMPTSQWLADCDRPPFGFDPAWRDAILRRQEAFWAWLERDLGRGELLPARSAHGRLGYSVSIPGLAMPVRVIGLDSAWLAGGDDDAGRLWLTEDQVALHCLDRGEPWPGFRIALMHHPLSDLADHGVASRYLADHVDLLLRGHQHDPIARAQLDPDRTLRELAAGCLFEGSRGNRHPNGCHVIDVSLDPQGRPLAYDIRFRSWSPSGHWHDDGAIYREARHGRLRWEITNRP